MEETARNIIFELLNQGLKIGSAESCTDGLIGAALSIVGGERQWYRGSIIANDNDLKIRLLEVTPNAIKTNGVVSSQVAAQMAIGGIYALGVDICVAITGNIDNWDESQGKEAWVCVAKATEKRTDFEYKKIELEGMKRGDNVQQCVNAALETLWKVLKEKKKEE